MDRRPTSSRFALYLIPFVVLATLNSGGYRYGASDQAFYQPAVLKHLDPGLFPRDTIVLATQTGLTAADDVMGLMTQATGLPLPIVFFVLYVAALALFAWGTWRIGLRLYASHWTAVALLAAMTLRHAIARSGTNTLEGYFQPRLMAYALGAAAIAAFLRGRVAAVFALLLVAGALHPTTALWFAVWLGGAALVAYPAYRRWLVAGAAAAGIIAIWALTDGPLAGRLAIMDDEWRQLLETKDYLFPLRWPAYAWIVNLGYLPLIAWIYRQRAGRGLVDARERALVFGSASLALIFAGALVLHAIGVTLAFQLQPARVFWMFDFLATIYAVWALSEGLFQRPAIVALVLLALSTARGAYVIREAERPPLQLTIADDDWGRAMAWARSTNKESAWLAHPMHAVRYGTSVRVAGERDVLVEAVKDAAMGMYDRRVAVRTAERIQAVPDFDALTEVEAQRLADRYDLDYMVTEQSLELPLVFESGRLRVYRLGRP